MSVPPTDSIRHVYPLFLADSRLYQASVKMIQEGQAQPAQPARTPGEQLRISTTEIFRLFERFKMRSMTYQDLLKIPMSQLSPAEKQFVLYLRKNPVIFERLARLDQNPGHLSPKDIKIAAQLAGDALVLTDRDLQYLRAATAEMPKAPQNQPPIKADAILAVLNKFGPPMPPTQLANVRSETFNLNAGELKILQFLQSQTVQRMLAHIGTPYGGMVGPDAIRVLTSLIWNPGVYGAMPIVLFKDALFEEEEETDPVSALPPLAPEGRHRHTAGRRMKIELDADRIKDVLCRISPDGDVSLAQLQAFQPEGIEEARIVNTLKQTKIFRELAARDENPDTLSTDDIRLAAGEGGVILYDQYLMVMIVP